MRLRLNAGTVILVLALLLAAALAAGFAAVVVLPYFGFAPLF
jgi:hypothetical protein